jgi:hypothetical protein
LGNGVIADAPKYLPFGVALSPEPALWRRMIEIMALWRGSYRP